MLKNHHFNVEIAKHFGVFAAVILDQFIYWIDQNTASGTHIHNGKAWACASYETLCKIFPYFTKRQIEHAIDKLIKTGIIEVGFFAKNRFNRTRYFSFTAKFQSIVNSKDYTLLCDFQNPKNDGIEHPKNDTFDFTKMGNEISQNCEMDSTNLGNEISQNCEMLCTTSCTTECTTNECTTNLQHAKNGGCVNVENPDFELTAIDEKPKPPKIRQPESEVLTPVQITWQAYKNAYLAKYGVEPVRSKKIFGQIKNFVDTVGQDNAPKIVDFYVLNCNNSWYIQKGHDIGTLLTNVQAISRDWQRGMVTTSIDAKQAESSSFYAGQMARAALYYPQGAAEYAKEQEQKNVR